MPYLGETPAVGSRSKVNATTHEMVIKIEQLEMLRDD